MPVARKYTARKAPHALKRPGTMAVEPRNAAEKAGNRSFPAELGSTEFWTPARAIPANAAPTLAASKAPALN